MYMICIGCKWLLLGWFNLWALVSQCTTRILCYVYTAYNAFISHVYLISIYK